MTQVDADPRPRVRDLGVVIGELPPGPFNAITDVAGVRVGHVTLIQGERVRTGVTAVLPHGGNIFREKVPAAIEVANGYGKLIGFTQVNELGELETPVILTNTLSVWDAAIGVVEYVLHLPGNANVRSVNPVVGETNDGYLNDIRGRHVRPEHVLQAIRAAETGPVAEGNVGAGTGTVCMGFKGGIGTASRVLSKDMGGWTIGVLVQTNFGGRPTLNGVPLWRKLAPPPRSPKASDSGSCMIIVATDAPLLATDLRRIARRAFTGMARAGASFSHGSGDYAIAFSTVRDPRTPVRGRQLDPLFVAVAEATEEAIWNSLSRARDMEGRDGHVVRAIPVQLLKQGAVTLR